MTLSVTGKAFHLVGGSTFVSGTTSINDYGRCGFSTASTSYVDLTWPLGRNTHAPSFTFVDGDNTDLVVTVLYAASGGGTFRIVRSGSGNTDVALSSATDPIQSIGASGWRVATNAALSFSGQTTTFQVKATAGTVYIAAVHLSRA